MSRLKPRARMARVASAPFITVGWGEV
jgi:hypothetical protein